jgi:hypothetical protein
MFDRSQLAFSAASIHPELILLRGFPYENFLGTQMQYLLLKKLLVLNVNIVQSDCRGVAKTFTLLKIERKSAKFL